MWKKNLVIEPQASKMALGTGRYCQFWPLYHFILCLTFQRKDETIEGWRETTHTLTVIMCDKIVGSRSTLCVAMFELLLDSQKS